MAKKTTSTSKTDATSDPVDVSPTVDEQGEVSIDLPDPAITEDAEPGSDISEAETEAETTDETPSEDDSADMPDAPEPEAEVEPEAEDLAEIEDTLAEEAEEPAALDDAMPTDPTPPRAVEPVVVRKASFLPMLFGGVLAGAIGFGAAYYVLPKNAADTDTFQTDVSARIDKQTADISALRDEIAKLPAPADTSQSEAALADMTTAVDDLTARIEAVQAQFAALDERLTTVEKRPMSEGASDAAVAAYERELQALQDAMAAQRAEIEAMTADAQSMEANAEQMAQATLRRAALTRIQTALDTGAGFAPALADLAASGVQVPQALNDAANEGVPSLAQLRTSFPEAARTALAQSRQAAAQSGEPSGFSTFLKNQLGTRSLEPREGDDPDAILSRAEAAARDGRLSDTLAEIEALPEAGRDALADWTNDVLRRQGAVAAAEALGQELN